MTKFCLNQEDDCLSVRCRLKRSNCKRSFKSCVYVDDETSQARRGKTLCDPRFVWPLGGSGQLRERVKKTSIFKLNTHKTKPGHFYGWSLGPKIPVTTPFCHFVSL